jgi:thiol-disulfide isomerase/thioredoxin
MPRIAPLLISFALVAAIAPIASCKREPSPPSGDIAAQLTVPTMAGPAFDPAILRGKPALVVFWRPGCPHCLAELPDAARAARERGVTAIAVQVSGKPETARAVLERSGWDGLALVDDGRLREALAIRAVPWTLVLRGDGTAARAFVGRQSYDHLSSALASVR